MGYLNCALRKAFCQMKRAQSVCRPPEQAPSKLEQLLRHTECAYYKSPQMILGAALPMIFAFGKVLRRLMIPAGVTRVPVRMRTLSFGSFLR
jgi:hypothetical protein